MGRGVIEAALFRSEQYQLEQRTSDPVNPEPNEEWLRVDIKPTYEDADGVTQTGVAQYRRANSSGTIETAPVAQLGHSTSTTVIDKVRAYINAGGSPTGTGFVPYATEGAEYPHRRLQHPSAGQVALHNLLTTNVIPDSVINRWPIQAGSGSTVTDAEGSSDISLNGSPTWESGTWIGDYILRFDGGDDYGESTATTPSGSMTSAVTVDFSTDITDIQAVHSFGPSTAGGDGRLLRFRGDLGTNTFQFLVSNGTDAFMVNTTISQGTHRIAGILDTSASEIRIAVDGAVQNTASVSGTFDGTVSNHHIGRRVDSNERYYGGGADEPLLANEAYSSSQLTDDYNRQPWS